MESISAENLILVTEDVLEENENLLLENHLFEYLVQRDEYSAAKKERIPCALEFRLQQKWCEQKECSRVYCWLGRSPDRFARVLSSRVPGYRS